MLCGALLGMYFVLRLLMNKRGLIALYGARHTLRSIT